MKARAPWGLWIFLTILVWGLFAPDRGLYHARLLSQVFAFQSERRPNQ